MRRNTNEDNIKKKLKKRKNSKIQSEEKVEEEKPVEIIDVQPKEIVIKEEVQVLSPDEELDIKKKEFEKLINNEDNIIEINIEDLRNNKKIDLIKKLKTNQKKIKLIKSLKEKYLSEKIDLNADQIIKIKSYKNLKRLSNTLTDLIENFTETQELEEPIEQNESQFIEIEEATIIDKTLSIEMRNITDSCNNMMKKFDKNKTENYSPLYDYCYLYGYDDFIYKISMK